MRGLLTSVIQSESTNMNPKFNLLKVCFVVIFGQLISGNLSADVKLTDKNALQGETLEDHVLHQLPEPNREALAEMVAGALVKDLEDSIKGLPLLFIIIGSSFQIQSSVWVLRELSVFQVTFLSEP